MLATAESIGMSAPGLRNFLEGGSPRRSTFRKLSEWHVREAARDGEVSDETVHAALTLLLDTIPESGRSEAASMVLDTIRAAHEKHNQALPDWWGRLRHEP